MSVVGAAVVGAAAPLYPSSPDAPASVSATPGAGEDGGSPAPEPQSGVKDDFATSRDDQPAAIVPPPLPEEGGADLSLLAVVLGLSMLGYALRRELKSH